MQKHDASKEIERLQSIVNVKDACIKNYTSYIKELKDKFKGENGVLDRGAKKKIAAILRS